MIFISYRRDDSAGYARALYDTLARRFGAERVFMDVDDIRAGQPFADVIRHAVGDAKVLLVLIGRRWPGVGEDGRRRIDDPADFVHQEVLAGLQRGLRVVPVLLDGVSMPGTAELPEPLQPLAGRHAVAVTGADYEGGVQRLLAALDDLPAASGRRRAWIGGAAALAVGAAGVAWWARPRPPARPAVDGEWQAEVEYDWPGARHRERFSFSADGERLQGSASFLGTPQGVLEGRIEADGLAFHTVTTELMGGESRSATHRYRARWQGDALHFTMQTEGGFSSHVPVQFVARRTGP